MSDEPKKPEDSEVPAGDSPAEGSQKPSAEPKAPSAEPKAPSAESKAPSTEPKVPSAESNAAAAKPKVPAAEKAKAEPASEAASDAPPEKTEAELAAEKEKAALAAKAKAEAAAKAKAVKDAAEAAKMPWERLPQPPQDEDASDNPLVKDLSERHGKAILEAFVCDGDLRVHVARESIADVCASLKNDLGYTMAEDLCGVHYPDREGAEFEVVYHLFNIAQNRRVRLKVALAEGETVPTTAILMKGMNWLEREAYDMYGIRFEGHPDMTRILLWEGFNGFPLRKDFPVEGIDTGSAIYPEYYDESAGPVTGTGTGWRPEPPPEPETPVEEGDG